MQLTQGLRRHHGWADRVVHRRSLRRHGRDAVRPLARQASRAHLAPGVRTAWPSHPNGQTIHVTEGIVLHRTATVGSSHPPRQPGVLRARPGPLARRRPQPLHHLRCDAGGRRRRHQRDLRRAVDRRGVRRRAGAIAARQRPTRMRLDEWQWRAGSDPAQPAGGYSLRDGPSRPSDRRAAGGRGGPERARPPPIGAVPDPVGVSLLTGRPPGAVRVGRQALGTPAGLQLDGAGPAQPRVVDGQPPPVPTSSSWSRRLRSRPDHMGIRNRAFRQPIWRHPRRDPDSVELQVADGSAE
jgi:hypothetical protein